MKLAKLSATSSTEPSGSMPSNRKGGYAAIADVLEGKLNDGFAAGIGLPANIASRQFLQQQQAVQRN